MLKGNLIRTRGSIAVILILLASFIAIPTAVVASESMLTLSVAGSGRGVVSFPGSGAACATTCYYFYNDGSQVTLSPAEDLGSVFAGWNGCNQVTGNQCTVTIDAAKTVTATFNAGPDVIGAWAPAGALANARDSYTATLLPNGKVLVAAGFNGGTILGSSELYDPATNSWSAAAPLNTARRMHTATLLPNGKVLVTGGDIGGFGTYTPIASVELYDPATNSWSAAAPMSTPRSRHTATLLPSGKVLVTGGETNGTGNLAGNVFYNTSAELYDPATNSWSAAGSMAAGRSMHKATLLADGRVVVIGGQNGYYSYLASAELYDPSTNRWSAAGSMTTARIDHAATLLPDGTVLVTGGYSSSGYLASTEVYDPAASSWKSVGSLALSRRAPAATLLPNGKVLVTGGYTWSSSGNSYFASTEMYDPATSSWKAVGSMRNAHAYHAATLLSDGKVLVTAGYRGGSYEIADAEVYDLYSSNRLLTTASPPGGTYSSSQTMTFTVTLTSNEPGTIYYTLDGTEPTTASSVYTGPIHISATVYVKFFAVGQYGSTESVKTERYVIGTHPLTVAVVGSGRGTVFIPTVGSCTATCSGSYYDGSKVTLSPTEDLGSVFAGWNGCDQVTDNQCTVTLAAAKTVTATFNAGPDIAGAWTLAGALATPRLGHTATLLPNNMVLVTGGNNGGELLSSSELYAPATNSWSAAAPMNTVRWLHTAIMLPNGKVLVTGGYVGGFGDYLANASAELYDPATSSWSAAAPMSTARGGHTATLLPNGKVLVTGGGTSSGSYNTSAELYDPATNSWSAAASMAAGRSLHKATLLADGRVLVIGGQNGYNSYLSSAELYDSTTDSWSAAGAMATARVDHTATLLTDGTVLVTGGYSLSGYLASSEVYDPATSSWKSVGSLTSSRRAPAATLLSNGKVLVTGGYREDTSGYSVYAYLASTEMYDPATSSWKSVGSMINAHADHAATLLSDGKVLVTAGARGGSYPISDAEVYDGYSSTIANTDPTKIDQTISFATLPAVMCGGSFALTGSATSGLSVRYTSSNPSVATVNGNVVTPTGVGTTIITATQNGDSNYNPATPVPRILTVNFSQLNENGKKSYFKNVSSSYDAIANGTSSSIMLVAGTIVDTLVSNKEIQLSIAGGYDASFTAVTGVSTIRGSILIQNGTVTIAGPIAVQ